MNNIFIYLILFIVFIALTIFSIKEYGGEKNKLDNTEDRFPAVNIVLSSFDSLRQLFSKIPVPDFLMAPKNEAEYNAIMVPNIDSDTNNEEKKGSQEETKIQGKLASITPELIKNTNWRDIFTKIKEALTRDWFQP